MNITPHFTLEEWTCHCGCGQMRFTEAAIWKVEILRVTFDRPMHVNSGYRCPDYNAVVSKTGRDGPHTIYENDNVTGDIGIYGTDAYDLIALAKPHGFTGLGLHQRGPQPKRYVHLDTLWQAVGRPRPWPWTY